MTFIQTLLACYVGALAACGSVIAVVIWADRRQWRGLR